MQRILVPVDFEAASYNAAKYAIRLAEVVGVEVVLFHAYELPSLVSDIVTFGFSHSSYIQDMKDKLERMRSDLVKELQPWSTVSYLLGMGPTVGQIIKTSKVQRADLVVMAMRNRPNDTSFFGSVALGLSRKSKIPVLFIPDYLPYEEVKTIVFAVDESNPRHHDAIDFLNILYDKLHFDLHLMHAIEPDGVLIEESSEKAHVLPIDRRLKKIPHHRHYAINSELCESIDKYSIELEANWVAIMAEPHSIFYRLVNFEIRQRILENIHLPMLLLPDCEKPLF